MDKGEFVKLPIEINPALKGGYIVKRAASLYEGQRVLETMAFSNYLDLLAWLMDEYPAANKGAERGPVGDN